MIFLQVHPPHIPSAVSKLDRRHTGRPRKKDNLPTGDGGERVGLGAAESYDRKKARSSINPLILSGGTLFFSMCTLTTQENKIPHILGNPEGSGCKVIQYMTNGLLVYSMTKYLCISSYMTLQLLASEFPYTVYEENLHFLFISV
jgi:hypothetical protein